MTRKDFWSVALLAASAAILLRDELFFHRTFFARDLLYLFHPWKALASEQLAAGILPLWNPYAAMGAPLLANFQSAIFYPISLPFYISHFPWALKLFHFLHFFLAGLGAYLFLRRLRFPRSGSWVGAGLFQLGGFLLSKIEFLSNLGTAIWLPWLLLFLPYSALVASAWLLSFWGGYPQDLAWQAVMLGIIPPLFGYRHGVKSLAAVLTGGAGALILGAALTLPGVEYILNSHRFHEALSPSVASLFAFSPRDLGSLVVPYWGANPPAAFTGEKFFYATTAYQGLFGTTLAALGLWSLGLPALLGIALYSSVVLLTSMGTLTPLFPFLYDHIFLFRVIRYPGKLLYLLMPIFFILAARGTARFKRWAGGCGLLVLIELLVYAKGFHPTLPHAFFYEKGPLVRLLQQEEKWGQKKWGQTLVQESGPVPISSVPFFPSRFFLSPRAEQRREGIGRSHRERWVDLKGRLFNLTGVPYHLYDLAGFGEPLSPARTEHFLNLVRSQPSAEHAKPYLSWAGVRWLALPEPATHDRPLKNGKPTVIARSGATGPTLFFIEKARPTHLRRRGTKQSPHSIRNREIASLPSVARNDAKNGFLYRGYTLWHLYENPDVFPFAFVVSKDAWNRLSLNTPGTLTPRHTPLIWKQISPLHVRLFPTGLTGYGIFTQAIYPGWIAWQAGKTLPLEAALETFTAFPLNGNDPPVTLRYHSCLWRTGLLLTVLGWVAVTAFGIIRAKYCLPKLWKSVLPSSSPPS